MRASRRLPGKISKNTKQAINGAPTGPLPSMPEPVSSAGSQAAEGPRGENNDAVNPQHGQIIAKINHAYNACRGQTSHTVYYLFATFYYFPPHSFLGVLDDSLGPMNGSLTPKSVARTVFLAHAKNTQ